MSEINTAKLQFKDAVAATGIDIREYIPERVIPPIVLMTGGGTYIVPETIGNEYTVGIVLTMISATAMNEQSTEKLDDLIEQTIMALPSFARMVRVAKPYSVSINNAEYLSADMEIEISITI